MRGLSIDDRPDYEEKLQWVCEHISLGEKVLYDALTQFPSIQIAVEAAFKSLRAQDPFQLFDTPFSKGEKSIPINGLIWMGDKHFMRSQIKEKLKDGFSCIKMKIGAIDFASEIALLKNIRQEFTASEIELRVDANGAFSPKGSLEKLKQLAALDIHSIEQPINQGQWEEMARLCEQSPLAIALDEELIGVFTEEKKIKLLDTIKPQYVILKPSFIGGFRGADRWIALAAEKSIDWWVTSALESNVGLNAIAQYTSTKNSILPQGLGTGNLYTNNVPSPLDVDHGAILYNIAAQWDLDILNH